MQKNYSLKGILVWLICVSFFFYEFFSRTLLGTFQEPIMRELQLNPAQFALLSSTAYLLVYGLMQLPIGAIVSRFGLKLTLFGACVTCVVACFGFAYATNYATAIAFRLLMGLGSSFGFVCLLIAVYNWIPYKNVALFIGFSQFLGTMGPMIAAGPINALSKTAMLSWQQVFIYLGVIGTILSFLMVCILSENTQQTGSFIILNLKTDLKKRYHGLKQKQVWWLAFSLALIYFNLEYLSENHGKALLVCKGFSDAYAAYMITIGWLGFAIGSPVCGYLSDKMSRRKPMLLFSSSVTCLSIAAIIYLPLNAFGMAVSFFGLGLGTGASSIGIVTIGEQFKLNDVSTGLSFNNAFIMLFVSSFAPFVEFILAKIAPSMSFHLRDFQEGFSLLVILPFISFFIIYFTVAETFGKSTKENLILNFEYGKK